MMPVRRPQKSLKISSTVRGVEEIDGISMEIELDLVAGYTERRLQGERSVKRKIENL